MGKNTWEKKSLISIENGRKYFRFCAHLIWKVGDTREQLLFICPAIFGVPLLKMARIHTYTFTVT